MGLYEEVQGLIETATVSRAEIARECGVSTKWVYRFMQDDYDDVGSRKLERIKKFLSEKRE